jgi:hypothetical protein
MLSPGRAPDRLGHVFQGPARRANGLSEVVGFFLGERSSRSKFSTKATRCASSAFVLRTNVAIVVQFHHPRRAEAPQAACQNVTCHRLVGY